MPFGTKEEFVEFLSLIKDQIATLPELTGPMPESTKALLDRLPREEQLRAAVSVTKKQAVKVLQTAMDIVATYKEE